jgi:hypothetical protein
MVTTDIQSLEDRLGVRLLNRSTRRISLTALSGNLQANSANALRLAAVQGQGLVMMPSFLVVDDIKSGRLVPVLKELLQTEYDIQAIYPHRHHLSAKVRRFVDLLIEHYRKTARGPIHASMHLIGSARRPVSIFVDRPRRGTLFMRNRRLANRQTPPVQAMATPDHVWGRRPDQIRGVISPEQALSSRASGAPRRWASAGESPSGSSHRHGMPRSAARPARKSAG